MSLIKFLKASKLKAVLSLVKNLAVDSATVHVVIGNEAADLDSMASAIVYAHINSKVSSFIK